ncbi:hypothetical protein [Paraburkholderia terrae]|uniref:hypothetical protein n=1 Tax=Paraburkholderia terrae TaxID=311230 RepID=UPI001EE2E651|nr:hypothetical protein [Paraburkholderia terrae]GJH02413.1 hypothetical protein CBA19C8_17670 [Paraburkholderia terrae]GJH37909.1 hypothetical protein CBA19CS91_34150 [Paraburkholderia hospita]
MDTIRKRPVPPHEQCDTTQETNLVAPRDHPAPPLDVLFPLDASAPHMRANPAADEASDPLPTYPPLFRRIRPRPRRIAAPTSVGTPDWKLSTGAAVVLLGFAIAFGTYITLTQRDAMQSRLRRIVTQNELRAMPRHDRPTIADRTQELARSLRDQIEALRSRDATDTAVMAGAAAHQSANAHSSTVASSTPSLPVATAPVSPPASPAKAPGKAPAKQTKQTNQLAAKPLAPPLPQPAPRTRQLANTTPTRAHSTTAAQPEHRTSTKQANTACGSRSPCVQANAQSPRKPVKVASKTPPAKATTTTVAARRTPVKNTTKPVQHTAPPPTVQAWSPPESPAALPASDDSQVYRQH